MYNNPLVIKTTSVLQSQKNGQQYVICTVISTYICNLYKQNWSWPGFLCTSLPLLPKYPITYNRQLHGPWSVPQLLRIPQTFSFSICLWLFLTALGEIEWGCCLAAKSAGCTPVWSGSSLPWSQAVVEAETHTLMPDCALARPCITAGTCARKVSGFSGTVIKAD